MKTDRLIGILTILLQQGKTTAPELAERFEVSRRTISRDIESLCRAGIPLVTAQGSGGGISIIEGYRLDAALFTEDERQALLAGLKGVCSVSNSPSLSGLAARLSGQRRCFPNDETLLIDLAAFWQRPLTQKIDTIRQAIQSKCLLSFRYYYPKGECQRVIEPYRLVFKWSSWYVLGYCRNRQGFRLFKLNRLWELETGGIFPARELPLQELSFDRYFQAETICLTALFSTQEKYRLIEEYGPDCYTQSADGRLLFERSFASYENMREWVLSFGDQAEVLSPGKLREDLRQQAENLLKKYQTSPKQT